MPAFFTGPLPLRFKLVHGFGAIAFGIKDSGFSFFLLIFYNQVLGMDAATVSLALLVALLVDALIDPLIGNLSDRTYTSWGRRLPWLYIAPIPLAIAWILLWSPPGGEAPGFWGLVTIACAVRIFLSACEVPSVSLVPEITDDYDERTTLFRYRFLAGWCGGLLMMVLAYTVFLPGSEGLLQQGGYLPFGICGAVLIAVSVIGSAAGQHRDIARTPPVRPGPFTFAAAFSEISQAFTNRAFLIFGGGALAAYVSQGLIFSITNYLNLFVWQLDGMELVIYPAVLFASALAMFVTVAPMHRAWGKAKTAAIAALAALVLSLAPYALLLAGAWPQPGTIASTAGYFALLLPANTMAVVTMISASSMIAEIVEAFEEKTGRRAEGAFYSGNWLIQKCATGLGIFLTGQIISLSGLPDGAQPGAVDQAVITDIIVYFGAILAVLAVIAAGFLFRFPISRADHDARLERLSARRTLDEAARGDIDAGTIVP